MGSMQVDCDVLDDSGCVQDDPLQKSEPESPVPQINLLDLSDDVLLYILRHCSPRDLKALGFSCARLGRLVRERSLWRSVDARSELCSRARLCWHLQHTLHADTRTLLLTGYAKVAAGCLGLANITRKEAEDEKQNYNRSAGNNDGDLVVYDVQHVRVPVFVERHRGRCFFNGQRSSALARYRGSPTWPGHVTTGRGGAAGCRGPQFTLSRPLCARLAACCANLTHLALDYCNIDCQVTSLQQLPRTLKKLSLRGSKLFNMTIDKSFLFKIQDYQPGLESLDVSECEWMDPASLLPLSKLEALTELSMRDCPKLAEFVAYASLTSRYGFKTLKSLDLRGSPVGDSEVSALGWLPRLERLWLSAARRRQPPRHLHYTDDEPAPHTELDDWEQEEPEYFKPTWTPEESEKSEASSHRPVQSTSTAFPSTSSRADDSASDSQASSEYSPPKKRKRYNEVVIGQRTESIDARDGEKYIHTLEIKVTIDDEGETRDKGEADKKSKENDTKASGSSSPKKDSPKKDPKDDKPKRDDDKGAGASTSKAGPSKSDKTEGYVCFRQNRNPIYVNFKKTAENDSDDDDADDNDDAKKDSSDKEKDSKDSSDKDSKDAKDDSEPGTSNEGERYVCFRKNRDPVYVNCSPEPAPPPRQVNYQIEPRHHVLYVNFGPQPSTYRFPRDENDQLRLDFRSSHINPSSLVTDFAIRRFGRADGEDVNIINLGYIYYNDAQGNNDVNNFRPDRSNLRFLSVTGYRNITDRSLVHLATSAPFLTEIDFTETSITERGAENFRSLRPDCRTGEDVMPGSVLLPATRRGRYLANIVRRQAVDGTGIKFNKDADRMNAEAKKKVDVLSEELLPYIIAEQERRTTLYKRVMTAVQNGEKGITVAEIRNKPPLIIRRGQLYRCPANRAPKEPDGSGTLMCEEDIEPTQISYDSCLSAEDRELYVARNKYFFCNRHRLEGPDLPRNGTAVVGCSPDERTSLNYTYRKCALEDSEDVVVHFRYYPDRTYKFVNELDPEREVCEHWSPCQIGYIYSLPAADQAVPASELWHDSMKENVPHLATNYTSSARRVDIPDGYVYRQLVHSSPVTGKKVPVPEKYTSVKKDNNTVTAKLVFPSWSRDKHTGEYYVEVVKGDKKKYIKFLTLASTTTALTPRSQGVLPGQKASPPSRRSMADPTKVTIPFRATRITLLSVLVRATDGRVYNVENTKYTYVDYTDVYGRSNQSITIDLEGLRAQDFGDYFLVIQNSDGIEERIKFLELLRPEIDINHEVVLSRVTRSIAVGEHFDYTLRYECAECSVADVLCNGRSVLSAGRVTVVPASNMISFNFPSFEDENACVYMGFFKHKDSILQEILAVIDNNSPEVTVTPQTVESPKIGSEVQPEIPYTCKTCSVENVYVNGVVLDSDLSVTTNKDGVPDPYYELKTSPTAILITIAEFTEVYQGVYQAVFKEAGQTITKTVMEIK
ncbi:uncharacterized protein LOC121736730 [Aricia agestis]|uniref:uncharacterized protein LOC121736730 n=1 Tax=Aricia agestis TaxID=91739 RepID=UPI001C20A87E|nr:uncharacterized protein LOC121736730 [Aricia agestis]